MSITTLRAHWLASLAAAEQAVALTHASGLLSPDEATRYRRHIAGDRDFVLARL